MNLEQLLSEKYKECMPLFIAYGDEVRLNIISLLYANRPNGLNVNEITSRTDLSRPAISHHLKILKEAGIIQIRHIGTSNFYYLTSLESVRKLKELGDLVEQAYKEY